MLLKLVWYVQLILQLHNLSHRVLLFQIFFVINGVIITGFMCKIPTTCVTISLSRKTVRTVSSPCPLKIRL